MTVRAVASVNGVFTSLSVPGMTTGNFAANIAYVGLDSSNLVEGFVLVKNIVPGILQSAFQSAIIAAVKADLTTNYGYSFGLFDTIDLIGGGLIGL